MKKLLLLAVWCCLFAFARAQTTDSVKPPPLPANGADPDNGPPQVFASVSTPPVIKGGMDSVHRYINKRMIYPPALLKAHKGGKVVLSFTVQTEGSISGVRAIQSPDERLSVAAIKAVQGLHFMPALKNGTAVSAVYSVTVRFDPDYPGVY
jgi:TonB family protein